MQLGKQDVELKAVLNMLEAVRTLFERGEVLQAARAQGYACAIEGVVIEGNRIGRTIGFPTANLKIDLSKPLPSRGVYVAMTRFEGKWHKSMVNIGIRPTLNLDKVAVEVYLIGFDGELYGKTLIVHFLERLRSEVRFPSLEELKQQLIKDQQMSIEEIDKLVLTPNPTDDRLFLKPSCASIV